VTSGSNGDSLKQKIGYFWWGVEAKIAPLRDRRLRPLSILIKMIVRRRYRLWFCVICLYIPSVIIKGPKIFALSGTIFSKAQKFSKIFIFSMKKIFFLMNKNSKKKKRKNNFIKILSGRGWKGLPLILL
jgi:hypothetical protein